MAWTWRNRQAIAAGIAKRSEVLSSLKEAETPDSALQATCEDARA